MTAPSFRNWLTTQAAVEPPTTFDNGLGITFSAAALVHRLASKLTEEWESPDDLHCLLHGSTELGDMACEALNDVRQPWEALVREFGPPLRPLTAATASTSLTDQQLAEIRARFEATTHPGWRDSTDVGRLLAEYDRLAAELDRARAELAERTQLLVDESSARERAQAELATAKAAITRTTARMQAYSQAGSGGVNPRQVINLLSLTWPDGNFTAAAAVPSA